MLAHNGVAIAWQPHYAEMVMDGVEHAFEGCAMQPNQRTDKFVQDPAVPHWIDSSARWLRTLDRAIARAKLDATRRVCDAVPLQRILVLCVCVYVNACDTQASKQQSL